ncbi:MAG: AIPR family protein [Firmicutes bacterium]|nr:AIPR family protein [Bacillota bacterium]
MAISQAAFGSQVEFEFFNHDSLLSILQATKPVSDSLQFSGKAIVEDLNYSRVFVGRIAVTEIAALIERHGERLLERNIRRYLGLQGNRVNEAISATLKGQDQANFYFYNNGITLICDKFTYNALQSGDYQVKIENLQIINGGQTCITIFKTLKTGILPKDAFVLVRLYQLLSDNDDLVRKIIYATNSQNPVDLKDLRANDDIQQRLQMDIQQLGFDYRRKRTDSALKSTDITTGTAAGAILSVWRKKPHQAKFFTHEHFGKLYHEIFSSDLNGAQVVTAVLIYRIAENKRKRPPENAEAFISYASCFIAMQMGKSLLRDLGIDQPGLNHQNYPLAKELIEKKGEDYFQKACQEIRQALDSLYGGAEISTQQLSATFRRGDLIEKLEKIDREQREDKKATE